MKENKDLFESFFKFAGDHPWFALSMVSSIASAAAEIVTAIVTKEKKDN